MKERFLLEWLSKEDTSALGECKGSALSQLIEHGYARIINPTAGDYARVMLTDVGRAALTEGDTK
jgi:hypothetical protein